MFDPITFLCCVALRMKGNRVFPESYPIAKINKNFRIIQPDEELLAQGSGKFRNLRRKMLADGFVESAYSILKDTALNHEKKSVRQDAAWELAIWHAGRESAEDAAECIQWLNLAIDSHSTPEKAWRAAVIRAECLARMGKPKKAAETIETSLLIKPVANLMLAAANQSAAINSKKDWLNKTYEQYGLDPVRTDPNPDFTAFASLNPIKDAIKRQCRNRNPQLTIIMFVFNNEETVGIAIKSIINQVFNDFELLIVDDGSSDSTCRQIRKYKNKDRRIRLIRSGKNLGPYVARNVALNIARGKYVTCHHAGSWAHPEKIGIQVAHLENHPEFIANKTQFALVDDNLRFYWPGEPGRFIKLNLNSLMFRRIVVMEELGCWDTSRMGPEEELILRMRKKFGEECIARLETGPVTLVNRQYAAVSEYFGIVNREYSNPVLREYFDSFSFFVKSGGAFKYDPGSEGLHYPVPEPLWPVREGEKGGRRHFDVILASDFRLSGGTNSSNAEQIKAQKKAGLKTGLVQINRIDLNTTEGMNEKIRVEIDGDRVQMVVFGEKIDCDLLVVRHPPVLQDYQEFVPDIRPEHVFVVINTSPLRDYSESGERVYDFRQCSENLKKYFGKAGLWGPIGPLVRDAVLKEDNIGSIITLSENNWHNIINDEEWYSAASCCTGKVPVIGRHTRDQYVKWPENREDLLAVYPDDDRFKVKILGGAKTAEDMLGRIPDNWEVFPFGSVSARQFLSEIDFCVYFHHKDLVEAFGRTPLEAMAAGVPVILPEHFRILFKDAAIYAQPAEVQDIVLKLFRDPRLYLEQVEKARQFIRENFSYAQHINRIRPFVKRLQE